MVVLGYMVTGGSGSAGGAVILKDKALFSSKMVNSHANDECV